MRRGQPLIMLLDLVLLALAFEVAYFLRFDYWYGGIAELRGFWVMVIVWLTTLYISGSYDYRNVSVRNYLFRVVVAALVSLGVVILINYFLQKDRSGIHGRTIILLGFMFAGAGAYFVRWIWTSTLRAREEHKTFSILVEPAKLTEIKSKMTQIFPKLKATWFTEVPDLAVIKDTHALILATAIAKWPEDSQEKLVDIRMQGQSVWEISHFFERELEKLPVHYLTTDWFLSTESFSLSSSPYFARVKRVFDLLLSTLLLILTFPIVILVGLMILIESGRPLFFSQIRVGKLGNRYKIWKFRTMVKDAEKNGAQWAQKNDTRITPLGNFLRKSRLDEIPQIYNVFRGEMSFIGPRPERPEFIVELEKEIPFYNLRHWVNPGITGWAQVNYPYGASTEDAREKLEYDLFYIKNFSLILDIKILLKTIRVVFLGHGR